MSEICPNICPKFCQNRPPVGRNLKHVSLQTTRLWGLSCTVRHAISKTTAGRLKFAIRVSTYNSCLKPASLSVKPAFLRSHLQSILECRTTKGAKTKNETDLTSVEIHITCRCNQRALWAVSILERHPIAKPTASRSNLNYVSLQTSHFSNQGFCAASCHHFRSLQNIKCDTQSQNRPPVGRN